MQQSGEDTKMLLILLLAGVWSVHGHGGMVWPPIWQDGVGLHIEEVYNNRIQSNPPVVDPKTGKFIDNTKSWGTDQAYTGGHGNYNHTGEGPHTNFDNCNVETPGDPWKCASSLHISMDLQAFPHCSCQSWCEDLPLCGCSCRDHRCKLGQSPTTWCCR